MYEHNGQEIELVDAQVHIWQTESEDFPWLPAWHDHDQRGGISPSAGDLIAEMNEGFVDRAVLVAPTFGGFPNNDVVADAVRRYPDRFAGMGLIDLSKPNPDLVSNWQSTTGMQGIRLNFRRGMAAPWLSDGTADWFWPLAEEAQLPLMLFCPGRTDELVQVLERHPGLRVALDHANLPSGGETPPMKETVEGTHVLARFHAVSIKATSFPSFAGEPYPYPTAQQLIRGLVQAFGPERVFWGTDLTKGTPGTYEQQARFLAEDGGLEDSDLELVMGKAIRAWLGWS